MPFPCASREGPWEKALRGPGLAGANHRDGRAVGTPRFRPGESHGPASSAFGGRIPGENPAWAWGDPAGKPRGARRETPWESPGSTWGEEGNGGRKPGERGARSDGSRRQWPNPAASIRCLQTRKGLPQAFSASGRNPSTPNFLAPKNRSDFLATRNSVGKPGENPATARKPDAPERPEAPGKSLRATCGKGHGGMGGVA
jgi:hypothetical protein